MSRWESQVIIQVELLPKPTHHFNNCAFLALAARFPADTRTWGPWLKFWGLRLALYNPGLGRDHLEPWCSLVLYPDCCYFLQTLPALLYQAGIDHIFQCMERKQTGKSVFQRQSMIWVLVPAMFNEQRYCQEELHPWNPQLILQRERAANSSPS